MKIKIGIVALVLLCVATLGFNAQAQGKRISKQIVHYYSAKQQIDINELEFLYDELWAFVESGEFSGHNKTMATAIANLLKKHDPELGYQAYRDIFLKEKKHEHLEQLYLDRINDFPESVIYKIELAVFFSTVLQDNEKSCMYFEKIIHEYPNAKIGLYMYGKTCAETGYNLDIGIECLEGYLSSENQLYPDLAHCCLGEIYLKKEDKERAVKEYEIALKINPENKIAQAAILNNK
ncbi:tetratricopeptide repeat protein [candidate division KSB1 bacterium]